MDTTSRSEDGPEGAASGVGRESDPTDQRREQGSESDQTIDSWGPDLKLRGVAHDMTNPAATMRFLAQLLYEESSDGRVQQVATQLMSEAAYLLDLCTEVLEGGHVEEIQVDQLAYRIVERTRLVSQVHVDADRPACGR
jgi:nitrogen-specific signal transduction histidine kinase